MRINRHSFRLHLVPASIAMAMTLGGVGWYGASSWAVGSWLGGGSLPGLVLGSIAALIIASEMLLWPRKFLRRFRLIPTKYWMAAHLWFGLACLPLGIVHSGFHLGGWLPTALVVLLVSTVVSGVYGLVVQQVLPKWMLRNLPCETIYSEIDDVARRAVDDAYELMVAACGPSRRQGVAVSIPEAENSLQSMIADPGRYDSGHAQAVVVGAPREAGRLRGRTVDIKTVTRQGEDAGVLWNAFEELRPYLTEGRSASSVFAEPSRAAAWFRQLRHACSAEADRVIGRLEQLVCQRRQFDVQRRVHRWLHAWLPVHIGLSVALCVLLVTHLVTALQYW